jgi:Bacterial toxin 44
MPPIVVCKKPLLPMRQHALWHLFGTKARQMWIQKDALRKAGFRHDQLRDTAGTPTGGQWTRESGSADAVPALRNNGEPIIYTGETVLGASGNILLRHGQQLWMPKDVSLSANAKIG